jgi:anti-sigma factor RsiW
MDMTQHITDNHDALLDYLYEEGDPAERLRIAKHLQECASCSVAVLEFQNVRGMLSDWTPPAADLGFRMVRDEGTSLDARMSRAPRGWRAWVPATPAGNWAQAAAAVVLFAAGMAVSQLSMHYNDGALTVRVRSAEIAAPAERAGAPADIFLPTQEATVTSVAAPPVAASPVVASRAAEPIDTEQLMQRVRAMIDQSEQRQQRELALRLSQVASEVDTQHQADLLRIQQNLGQQQDDFMNYLVRTGVTK